MPVLYENVFVNAAGMYLPGAAVDNSGMNAIIGSINRHSERLKRRILQENGIRTRHYAIDAQGHTLTSQAGMAAQAIRACIKQSNLNLGDIGLLAAASSGGDAIMPGFANQIMGELAAPPMENLSAQGVCASSLTALQYAASSLELGCHPHAVVVASEMPSRLFKRSRFAPLNWQLDFNAHFLRWMLSDGAGAVLLSGTPVALPTKHANTQHSTAKTPDQSPLALRLRWIHSKSFSGDFAPCMYLGTDAHAQESYLDFPSAAEAEKAGLMALRQDVRLLPQLFDIAVHEYAALVQNGWVNPAEVSHFLCHYSSEKFAGVTDELMRQAGLGIDRSKWWSNLTTRGNTGAASILIMLAEFLQTHELAAGDTIFCFVPESGRFTVSYCLFEATEVAELAQATHTAGATPQVIPTPTPEHTGAAVAASAADTDSAASAATIALPLPPHTAGANDTPVLADLLQSLAAIWHSYRSQAWRTPIVRKLMDGSFTQQDYLRWMENWIPQVREGSHWMRHAAANLRGDYAAIRELINLHASEEQNDFLLLFDDYRRAGGTAQSLDALQRNPGGDALNSYMYALAGQENAVELLGGVYIIEGTGQRIIPQLLPRLKQLNCVPVDATRFLQYHGENDPHHLERWLQCVKMALQVDAEHVSTSIQAVAHDVAELYLMQWRQIR